MTKYAYRTTWQGGEHGVFYGPFGRTQWRGDIAGTRGAWEATLWGRGGLIGRGKTRDAAVDDAYRQDQPPAVTPALIEDDEPECCDLCGEPIAPHYETVTYGQQGSHASCSRAALADAAFFAGQPATPAMEEGK